MVWDYPLVQMLYTISNFVCDHRKHVLYSENHGILFINALFKIAIERVLLAKCK